jgi:hypothetical protein
MKAEAGKMCNFTAVGGFLKINNIQSNLHISACKEIF